MSTLTIRPTATKPYSLPKAAMSPIATEADVQAAAAVMNEYNDAAYVALATVSQADSTATDVAGIVADFNTLLANLRTAGVLAP